MTVAVSNASKPRRTTGSTRGMTVADLVSEIQRNTYARGRPPLWMRKNRRFFVLVRRLLKAVG